MTFAAEIFQTIYQHTVLHSTVINFYTRQRILHVLNPKITDFRDGLRVRSFERVSSLLAKRTGGEVQRTLRVLQ